LFEEDSNELPLDLSFSSSLCSTLGLDYNSREAAGEAAGVLGSVSTLELLSEIVPFAIRHSLSVFNSI
jgi:hypothetical protein